jgi:hypothetical protein
VIIDTILLAENHCDNFPTFKFGLCYVFGFWILLDGGVYLANVNFDSYNMLTNCWKGA